MRHKVVISALFGNYLRWPDAVSTLGTYTLHKRAGFFKRWWRVLSTVRPAPGVIVSKLGLPSPGIESLRPIPHMAWAPGQEPILSIHGFTEDEWPKLVHIAFGLGYLQIELNLSCPNVAGIDVWEVSRICRRLVNMETTDGLCGLRFIAKLGPINPVDTVGRLMDLGISRFHLCNAIPTPLGSVSGYPCKPFALRAIEESRRLYGASLRVIGGGGIRTLQDAQDFMNAGADDVALGSVLFYPWKWGLVREIQEYLRGLE